MRWLVMLAALAASASAGAQDLSGEWRFERQARNGSHAGTIVIDATGQVRQSARSPIQDYAQCGILKIAGEQVEIVFTSVKSTYGYSLDHFYCTLRQGALRCQNADGIGWEPDAFTIRRIGGIPESPLGRLEEVCPARQRPLSQARRPGGFA